MIRSELTIDPTGELRDSWNKDGARYCSAKRSLRAHLYRYCLLICEENGIVLPQNAIINIDGDTASVVITKVYANPYDGTKYHDMADYTFVAYKLRAGQMVSKAVLSANINDVLRISK